MNSALLPLALAVPTAAWYGYLQLRGYSDRAPHSLARPHDLAALTPRHVQRTARRLRTLKERRPPMGECGVRLGQLQPRGPDLYATWEDVAVAIMAPRTGKTTTLAIPAVLNAPGPVVTTSNKADLWAATTDQHSWVFDPQQIVRAEQTWWWNPLGLVDNVEDAYRFATHFLGTIDDDGKRDIWNQGARDLIAGYTLAAHYGAHSLLDVHDWLCRPHITEPVDLLHRHGFRQMAESITDKMNSAEKTRTSFYVTATTAMSCLADPRITSWVTYKSGVRQFNPHVFVHTTDRLHLLSKEGGGSAAPLVAALTDAVIRAGIIAAEQAGGRLDPPLMLVLDEAANVCRIADLPKLYSHLGSRNIFPLTVLQSYAQGAQVWGHTGIKELWGAATIKLIGAGVDDASFASDLSRLVGEHNVPTVNYGYGHGGRSHNRGMRRDRIMSPADIRALGKGTAILFATGNRPALIKLQPWYKNRR